MVLVDQNRKGGRKGDKGREERRKGEKGWKEEGGKFYNELKNINQLNKKE